MLTSLDYGFCAIFAVNNTHKVGLSQYSPLQQQQNHDTEQHHRREHPDEHLRCQARPEPAALRCIFLLHTSMLSDRLRPLGTRVYS